MYDLERFGLAEMTDLCAAMRGFAANARSMEDVASRAARLLYDELGDASQRACALVAKPVTPDALIGALERACQARAHVTSEKVSHAGRSDRVAALLDEGTVNELVSQLGHEEVSLILADFIRDAHRLLDAMLVAAQTGNAAGLSAHTHSLKGASQTVGAIAFSAGCQRIEALAGATALADSIPLIRVLIGDLPGLAAAVADASSKTSV